MTTTTGTPRPRVAGATEALDDYLAHRGAAPTRPPLRYLRNKPGRGLVAVFGPGDGGDIYTVTLDQRSDPDLPADGARPTIQQFPVDPKLPHLDAVMSPAAQPALAAALESKDTGTGARPVVVDVNPFPGFRGAREPAGSLLRFLSTVTTDRTVTA